MIIAKGGRIKVIEGTAAEVSVEAVMILHAIYEKHKEAFGERRAEEELEKIVRVAKMSEEELLGLREGDEHAN